MIAMDSSHCTCVSEDQVTQARWLSGLVSLGNRVLINVRESGSLADSSDYVSHIRIT